MNNIDNQLDSIITAY